MSHDDALPAGHRLRHYRIERVLGRGGFGVTYLAVDDRGGCRVAVKEYLPADCADRGADQRVVARPGDRREDDFAWGLARFREEGRVLARFRHPSIVRVVDEFEAHGTGYLVMDYVAGETLSARLRAGPLDEAGALAVVLPIVDGLAQVHAADYLHRDIKPANIVIGPDGAPVLLDFGAARRALDDRTRSLTALYTPGYAPIEQYARDGRHGPWTDIYALGAVLYRCLAGRPPPDAPARVSADELVPLGDAALRPTSPGLEAAVRAALAVGADDRPRTLAAWRRMLRPPPSPPPPAEADDAVSSGGDAGGEPSAAPTAGAAGLEEQRRRLVDWVRGQLVGPVSPDGILGSPVERYPTGVLHPVDPGGRGATGLDPAPPGEDEGGPRPDPAGARTPEESDAAALLADDEDDESRDDDGAAGGVTARPIGRRRYAPPSSIGVSFYVLGEARVRVSASAASYRRRRERAPSGEFTTQPPAVEEAGDGREADDVGRGGRAGYERRELACGLTWPAGAAETSRDIERSVRRQPYRDGDVLSAAFSAAAANRAAAGGAPGWRAQIDVRRRRYREGHILTVVFANREGARPGRDRAEQRLFEARLTCEIDAGELAEYPRVDPALLTEEEREIELRHRDKRIYAVGHGAAADWALAEGRARIWTECMPAVEAPVATQEVAGLDPDVLVMHDIAEGPADAVIGRFGAFVDRYDRWVRGQRAAAAGLADGAAASRICDRMDAARERLRGGVERLRGDAPAATAFRLANRAMLDQMRQYDKVLERKKDVRDYRWRPFQLAFLLAVIESTIDEDDPCRGVLDLIWFPTGGGKTEAYLGLFAFLAVWRRLRYGADGAGTAVLMRYTLRLLTRQQFERAARIVCALERLRRGNPEQLGHEPVTVGLWVGEAASPNTFREAAKRVADLAEDGGPAVGRAHHLVLQSCPWCGRAFTAPHSFRADQAGFHFLCGNPECDFGDGRPLPCNVVDEALYAQPPTLLVGTIDKFARLAWEDRAAAFFGRGGRRPPELVIQDELHLVAGPLGSVAGLYEAAVETVLELRGARPKYVASTATIRMAGEQVRRLYGRETAVFPPPGLSAADSWFARNDDSRPGRLYVGYLAPGLDRRHCLAPLAATLLAAPLALFADQPDRDDLLDAWWTQVVYHGSLRGVGDSHNAFVTDVRAFLQRLEAERREAIREGPAEVSHSSAGDDDAADAARRRGEPAVAQLTSQSTAQENARTFDRLKSPRGASDCLDAVLATNMVSVGVDVDRLAAMVVNGQPFTTAEYIQASSRIGRAGVPGLVFANYYRHQARSLSHYENFRPYHESFYRFVEPTSVTPFTRQVRKRALHAALVIAMRHGGDAWTDNAAAGRFDRGDPKLQAAVEALKRRCRAAAGAAGADTAAHLDRLVDEWADEAARCRRERRGLQYHARDGAADSLLVSFESARRGRWRTLNSMRNVEDTAALQAERPTVRAGGSADGARRDG